MSDVLASNEMRDPVHGDVQFTDLEGKIMNSRSFQRLRRVMQIPWVRYVFPAATHDRFSQSVGTLHITARILDSIDYHLRRHGQHALSDSTVELARICALLSDIEDPPFHPIFLEDENNSTVINEIRTAIKSERIDEIGTELERTAFDVQSVKAIFEAKRGDEHYFIRQILESEVSADKIDYLERDAYFCGVPYGRIDDRILRQFTVENGELVLTKEAVPLVDEIFHAESLMKSSVYDHRVARAVLTVVRRAYHEYMGQRGSRRKLIRELLVTDDNRFLRMLSDAEQQPSGVVDLIEKRKVPKAAYVVEGSLLKNLGLVREFASLRYKTGEIESELANSIGIPISLDFVPIRLRPEPVMRFRVNSTTALLKDAPLLGDWYGEESKWLRSWKMIIFSDESDRIEAAEKAHHVFSCFEITGPSRPEVEIATFKNSKLYEALEEETARKEVARYEQIVAALPPDKLLTLRAVGEKGPMTAFQVHNVTNRSRSTESLSLNELVREGLLEKYKAGRETVFRIRQPLRKVL